MGGGGGVINTISTVATGIVNPVVATVGLAKGADEKLNDGKVTETVDKAPIVGTLSQGVTASGELYGDVAVGVATGDFSELRKDAVPAAKMGLVVGAGAAGAAVAGSAAVLPAVQIGDGIAKRGIDVGALTGAAAAYFGNTLYDNTGIDLNKFLPKPGEGKPPGSFDYGGGSVSDYFEGGPSLLGAGEDNTMTLVLGSVFLIMVLVAFKKRR